MTGERCSQSEEPTPSDRSTVPMCTNITDRGHLITNHKAKAKLWKPAALGCRPATQPDWVSFFLLSVSGQRITTSRSFFGLCFVLFSSDNFIWVDAGIILLLKKRTVLNYFCFFNCWTIVDIFFLFFVLFIEWWVGLSVKCESVIKYKPTSTEHKS